MVPPEASSVPRVTILGGFLGAGKTTVLNAILRQADERFAVIVNDFGAINIDAELTAGIDAFEDEVALSNGCICCTLRGDLLEAILKLLARRNPPAHILIETSGVSDPLAVLSTFTQPGIESFVRLNALVVVVDPTTYPALTGTNRSVARRQIASADLVLLSKTDLLDEVGVEAAMARIRRDVRHVRIVRSRRDRVPTSLLLDSEGGERPPTTAAALDVHVHEAGTTHGHHHGHALEFSSWSFESDEVLSLPKLRRAISRLPPEVFRMKGILSVASEPSRRVVLQVVGPRAELDYGAPWGADARRSRLVALGAAGRLDDVALRDAFEGCQARHPGERSEGGLLGYVRRLWDAVM